MRAAPPDAQTLIAALPPSLQPLARRAAIIRFARRELLIRQGVRGDTLYIVLDGEVRAFSSDATGSRQVTFGHYGPGEYVGEMSLDGGLRSASVEATRPTCCAMVTLRTLEQYIGECPSFALELLAKVIWRARVATLNASSVVITDAYERLRDGLAALARPGHDGRLRIAPRPTHGELAARVFATRTTVSKLLKGLRDGGYLQDDADALVLLRPLPRRW